MRKFYNFELQVAIDLILLRKHVRGAHWKCLIETFPGFAQA